MKDGITNEEKLFLFVQHPILLMQLLACLHSDGTPNEPKYTRLSRLQHLIADRSEVLLSQDSIRTSLPYWNGTT
jgi:hypothetical protein